MPSMFKSVNKYLARAKALPDPRISQPAKVISGVMGYSDRLLGTSASKMRAKADLAKGLAKLPSSRTTRIPEFAKKLDQKAKDLTTASTNTRIRTGLVIGGGVLANKALKNYSQSVNQDQYAAYDPSMYSYSNHI